MTKKRQSSQRPAREVSIGGKDPGYAIFRSLARVITESPRSAPLWLENDGLDERRRGAMPMVAWGWLQRTVRSGEAAIKLEKSGYGVEAAPLLRSSLEHAIRLVWADSVGNRFIDVAMISKQFTSTRLIEAQEHGWKFDAEMVARMEAYADEIVGVSKDLGSLKHLKNAVFSTPTTLEETGSLYMAWLAYTAESHPSIDTAEPYTVPSSDGHHVALLNTATPRKVRDCAAVAIFAVIAAAYGYSRLTDLDDYFLPRIAAIMRSHAGYFEDVPVSVNTTN